MDTYDKVISELKKRKKGS